MAWVLGCSFAQSSEQWGLKEGHGVHFRLWDTHCLVWEPQGAETRDLDWLCVQGEHRVTRVLARTHQAIGSQRGE